MERDRIERDPMLETGLPSNVEAEKAVLGAITLNNLLLGQALLFLEKSDFILTSHRLIFDAMVSLEDSGNPIDSVTLPELLRERNELAQSGGVPYLAQLVDGVPRTDTVEYYCRIVKQKSRERAAIGIINDFRSQLVVGDEDFDSILLRLESTLAKIREASKDRAMTGIYSTLDNLFSTEVDDPEEILFGVHRGEVGGLLAITNLGKSTLLYNAALSIAAGETCAPLATNVSAPRRVLFVDSESPISRAKTDLRRMLLGLSNPELAQENFCLVVDAGIDGEPLNLTKPDHFRRIVTLAKAHRADLIILDTAPSAFELKDENNNAEVTRCVMNPLKKLAREVNCAVVFSHHMGKATETHTAEAAYRGRGASAWGALSRAVFTIERDAKKGPNYIILNCSKVKGQRFEPILLRLNFDSRWFEVCGESPEAQPATLSAQDIANFVSQQKEVTTKEINSHFRKGRLSLRTVTDRIREAKGLGLIWKDKQRDPWRVGSGKDGQPAALVEEAEKSLDAASARVGKSSKAVHSALPGFDVGSKSDLGNAALTPNNSSARVGESSKALLGANSRSNFGCPPESVLCSGCGVRGMLNSHCERCGEFLREF